MNIIAIEGMQFYAHHGYHKEEQILGGKYTVDIYITADLTEAAQNDDLQKTINYEKVYAITRGEMEKHSKLVEHVCQRIASAVKNNFPQIEKLRVRVSKFQPPLKGNVERVFYEMEL
ncbi:MAG: dihydroneopterin aldolase [Chitinophagales bacterium]|nr:dihydroneopterin aldolase [Chitinophagales bacterium]MDW8273575.1 dihydroneopterin aldolase [Chitinophagales bacterium]